MKPELRGSPPPRPYMTGGGGNRPQHCEHCGRESVPCEQCRAVKPEDASQGVCGDTRGAAGRTGPVRPAPVDVGGTQEPPSRRGEASPEHRCHGAPVPSLGIGRVIVTALTPAGRHVPGGTPGGVLQSQHAREGVAADDCPSPGDGDHAPSRFTWHAVQFSRNVRSQPVGVRQRRLPWSSGWCGVLRIRSDPPVQVGIKRQAATLIKRSCPQLLLRS